MTVAYDDENKQFHCLNFHCSKQTMKSVGDGVERLSKLVAGRDVTCLDSKAHYDCFPLAPKRCWEAMPTVHIEKLKDVKQMKAFLIKCLTRMRKIAPAAWRRLYASAAETYSELQRRDVISNGSRHRAIYHLDTVSGRSRVTSFPLQTMTSDLHPDGDRHWFIHLDWLSADLRAASLLSGDVAMQGTFLRSDPYTTMSKMLGVDREECKTAMLQAIYSLSADNEILVCFPTFRDWMAKQIAAVRDGTPISTLLGRKFVRTQINGEKTIFNATIQGTVAHAMHASLRRIYDKWPDNLFTELQDSIVLIAAKDEIEQVLSVAVPIMLRPFAGLLKSNPTFPLRISIGKRWRKWQTFKEVRESDEQTEPEESGEKQKEKAKS